MFKVKGWSDTYRKYIGTNLNFTDQTSAEIMAEKRSLLYPIVYGVFRGKQLLCTWENGERKER